jgi:hypothetical protein
MGKNTFRWRAFVSFLLLFSFLLSGISGVILFLRPEGSLAAWSGWALLGLDKRGWEAVHAVAIVYFLLGAGVHLAFNGRALLAYCRRKTGLIAAARRGTGACRELALALLLSALVLAAALGGWIPARWIIEMRAGFKSGAGAVNVPPPVVDAEQRTLAELCPLLGTDESRLLAVARRAGIRVDSPAQTLADVARKNGLSPEEVYILLGGKEFADPGEKRPMTTKK